MFTSVMKGYCIAVNRMVLWLGNTVAYLVPLLALTVIYEVFSRYFLGVPTIWAYDVSLFLFGYIAALSGALAQQNRAHINVDVFYLTVSKRTRALFDLFSYSLAVFFLLVVAKMCLGKFEEAVEFNYRRQSEWAPEMAHFWVMMIVACAMFVLQLSSDFLQSLYFFLTRHSLLDPRHPRIDLNDDKPCAAHPVEGL